MGHEIKGEIQKSPDHKTETPDGNQGNPKTPPVFDEHPKEHAPKQPASPPAQPAHKPA